MTSKPIMLMLVALFVQQIAMSNFIRDGHSIIRMNWGQMKTTCEDRLGVKP